MAVIEKMEAKQQIIERLDKLSAETLREVFSYVEFISLDPVSRSLLNCGVDEQPPTDKALALIEEAAKEPRPGVPDEQIRRELGL